MTANWKFEKVVNMVKKAVQEKQEIINEGVDNYHVRLMPGNSKTGKTTWTVSLIPGHDCQNCKHCLNGCYDIKADLIYPSCRKYRVINSAIHEKDLERYWKEISDQCEENGIILLRINVGGDLAYEDFPYVKNLAKEHPKMKILFFTKNYTDLNRFLDEDQFPENVQAIMSGWKNCQPVNPHQLPEAHVLYADGTRTWDKTAKWCPGNCSKCYLKELGCWDLKKGEAVVFNEH